jgi:hypothetical protein
MPSTSSAADSTAARSRLRQPLAPTGWPAGASMAHSAAHAARSPAAPEGPELVRTPATLTRKVS